MHGEHRDRARRPALRRLGEEAGGHGGDGGDSAGQLTGDPGGDPTSGGEAGGAHPGRVDAEARLEVVEQVGRETQLVDPELDSAGAGPERPAGPDREAVGVDGQEAAAVGQLGQAGDVVQVGGGPTVAVEEQHGWFRPARPVAGRDVDPVAAPLRPGGQGRVGRHLQVLGPARADGRAPAAACAVDPAGRVASRRGRRGPRQRTGEGLGGRGRRVVPVLEAARSTRPPAELVGEGRRLAAPFALPAERHRPGATVERPGDAGLTAAAGSWQAEPDTVVGADLAKPVGDPAPADLAALGRAGYGRAVQGHADDAQPERRCAGPGRGGWLPVPAGAGGQEQAHQAGQGRAGGQHGNLPESLSDPHRAVPTMLALTPRVSTEIQRPRPDLNQARSSLLHRCRRRTGQSRSSRRSGHGRRRCRSAGCHRCRGR
jgi:hypothetical protein